MNYQFHKNLKEIRKKYGLSQTELGELLNLVMAQISSYERGLSNPNLALLSRLCQLFSLSLDELITINDFYREAFYYDAALTQDQYFLSYFLTPEKFTTYQVTNKLREDFRAQGGFIRTPIEAHIFHYEGLYFSAPYSNFLLLDSISPNIVSNFFTDNFDKLSTLNNENLFALLNRPTDDIFLPNGAILLMDLYGTFKKRDWLGETQLDPTQRKNILALKLNNNHIVRLYIGAPAYGCPLFAVYNEHIETEINNWFTLSKAERIATARALALAELHHQINIDDKVDPPTQESGTFSKLLKLFKRKK